MKDRQKETVVENEVILLLVGGIGTGALIVGKGEQGHVGVPGVVAVESLNPEIPRKGGAVIALKGAEKKTRIELRYLFEN